MKIIKRILLLIIMIPGLSNSQVIKSFSPNQIGPDALKNMVYIYNKADTDILYSVSVDCKAWQAEKIGELKDVIFRIDLYVSLGTGNEQVIYSLKKGNSYYIEWDRTEERYVILRRKPENSD